MTGYERKTLRCLGTIVAVGLVGIVTAGNASAAVLTWSNSGTAWNTASNWGGTAPGSFDTGLFSLSGSYTYQPNLTATATVGGLWDTGSGTLTIGGSTLTLSGTSINGSVAAEGIEMDPGAGALTISAPLALGAAQQWGNNSSSLLTVSGGVANGGNLLTVAGSGNATISSAVSGAGGLTMSGSGLLALSGNNTYAGTTAINSGMLSIAGTSSLPGWSISGSYSVASGAALVMGNAVTDSNIASILTTGNFAAGAALGFDTTAGGRTYASAIANTTSGALGLVKIGANTLTLTGSSTYTGGTTIVAGTLQIGGAGVLGNGNYSAPIVNNGALVIGTSSNQTFGGVISGSGPVSQSGPGSVTLSAANTYTGTTTVNNGILALSFSAAGAPTNNIINNAANSSGLSLSNGTLAIQGNLSVANSQRFNGLTVNAGASALQVFSGSGGTANVSLGSISRSAGGTLDFTLPASGGIATTSTNLVGATVLVDATGSWTAYATVNGGSTFATISSGQIVGLTNYSYTNAFTGNSYNTSVLITQNTSVSGVTGGVVAFKNPNTALTLTGNNDLVDAGGLLVEPAATGTVITGGSIHAGGGNGVVLLDYGALNVASAIVIGGGATS